MSALTARCPTCGATHAVPEADALAAQIADLKARLSACEERAQRTIDAIYKELEEYRAKAKAAHS